MGIGKISLFFTSPLLNPISRTSAENICPAQQSTSPLCILKYLWGLKDAVQRYDVEQIDEACAFPWLHSYTPSLFQ